MSRYILWGGIKWKHNEKYQDRKLERHGSPTYRSLWWARRDLNPRHVDFQSTATTNWATGPYYLNIKHHSTIVRIHSRSLFSNFCVYISLFQIFLLQDTIFVLQNVGLEPTTYCLSDNCSPIWANLATKLFAVCALYKNTKRKEKSLWFLGCERWDSNPRSPAYEAGDLAACLLRNGCSRRIRTSYPGYEPGVLPLDDHCNIRGGMFFRSEPPRPHMKGNEPQK